MAKTVMTNIEFDEHLQEFSTHTKYAQGFFGEVLTKSRLDDRRSRYPKWYNEEAKIKGKKMGMTNYEYLLQFTQGDEAGKWFGGDCVCIQKGILWGYRATPYPGGTPGKYASNGVPDTDADSWYTKYCTDRKTLSNPRNLKDYDYPVGSILHANGHIGEDHNNDKNTVLECAPSVDGLNEASLLNQSSGSTCLWNGIGKSQFIEYVDKKKTDGTIEVGDKVVVNEGAVYGGSSYGVKVPDAVIGKVLTVSKVGVNNNEDEALLQEINSWVAFKYLTEVTVSSSSSSASSSKPVDPIYNNVDMSKIVKGDKVEIRKGAIYGGSAWSKKIAVPQSFIGLPLTVSKVQTNNGQLEALIKELYSWVPTKYLIKVKEKGVSAKVNVGVLNVRKGPGSVLYRVVGQLKYGDKVTVYEVKGKWSRIGVDRWVYSPYLI